MGAWKLLAVVGWSFLIVGGMDVGLVWYPMAFGNEGWEFGSVTTSLNGLPLPVMGTALILASGIARGDKVSARIAQVVALLFVLAVAAMVVLYALTVPLALRSIVDPIALTGLKKAIVRSAFQVVVYPAVLLFVVWRANRMIRHGDVS